MNSKTSGHLTKDSKELSFGIAVGMTPSDVRVPEFSSKLLTPALSYYRHRDAALMTQENRVPAIHVKFLVEFLTPDS